MVGEGGIETERERWKEREVGREASERERRARGDKSKEKNKKSIAQRELEGTWLAKK